MSTELGNNNIGKDWLVDSSIVDSKDGRTRVIFYDPCYELHVEEVLVDLEGLTIEKIAAIKDLALTEITYGDVQLEYVPKAQQKKLKNKLKLLHGRNGKI